jgi:hypothetical protein
MKHNGKHGSNSEVAYLQGPAVSEELPVHISVRTPTNSNLLCMLGSDSSGKNDGTNVTWIQFITGI